MPAHTANPISIAPVRIISKLALIRFFGGCQVSSAFSGDGLEYSFFFFVSTPKERKKVPKAKTVAPSRNKRSLKMTKCDFPRNAPVLSLRYAPPNKTTQTSTSVRIPTVKRTFLTSSSLSRFNFSLLTTRMVNLKDNWCLNKLKRIYLPWIALQVYLGFHQY